MATIVTRTGELEAVRMDKETYFRINHNIALTAQRANRDPAFLQELYGNMCEYLGYGFYHYLGMTCAQRVMLESFAISLSCYGTFTVDQYNAAISFLNNDAAVLI